MIENNLFCFYCLRVTPGSSTKEDQRRLSGEAKCGELIQSFYIILLTNKLFAWRKNYKVFTVQRVFEDVSRAEEM